MGLREDAEAKHRATIVDAAIRDGKISPKRRDFFIKAMAQDPRGTQAVLASIPPGVPNGPTATSPAKPEAGGSWFQHGDSGSTGADSGSWLSPVMDACSPLTEEAQAVWAKSGVKPPPVYDGDWFPNL